MVLFSLIHPFYILCQHGSIIWENTYGGASSDYCFSIENTSDGGYILAGVSESDEGQVSDHKGLYDFWIIRTNLFGDIVWEKSMGGTGNEGAYRIKETKDGDFIAVGYSTHANGDVTSNKGGADFWIVKLDESGNLLWQKSYGGSGADAAFEVFEASNGSFIVAGTSSSNDGDVTGHHGGMDVWVLSLDSIGNLIWEHSYGGTLNDGGAGGGLALSGLSMTSQDDSTFVFTCPTESADGDVASKTIEHVTNYWVVKIDLHGKILFENNYGGSWPDIPYAIAATSDGGYLINGASRSNDGDVNGHHGSVTNFDYWVLKLDATGNIQWNRSLGGTDYDSGHSIIETEAGGYFVSGRSKSSDGDRTMAYDSWDFWAIYLDKSGNILWQNHFGGSKIDQCNAIVEGLDGSILMAGYTDSEDHDVFLNRGELDWWVVKISNMPNIVSIEPRIKDSNLLSIFPNPTSDQFQVLLPNNAIESPIRVEVYDFIGKHIFSEVLNINFSTHNVTINLGDFVSGIYEVRLIITHELWRGIVVIN